MAENPYLDLSIAVTCQRYDLDENLWTLTGFSESSKTFTVSMESEDGCKVRATFPRDEIRFEEMKGWSEERKLVYLTNMTEAGHTLHPKLVDSFQQAMLKLDVPLAVKDEDTVIVEDKEAEVSEVSEVEAEATKEESDTKDLRKKFKRKAV